MKKIEIEEQEDGNWFGTYTKDGVVLKARQVSPQTVLQLLLTHNGNENVIAE